MKKYLAVLAGLILFCVPVFAANEGEGTAIISPVLVLTSSTGNTETITITKGATSYNAGFVAVTIAAGWTAPSQVSDNAGYYTYSMSGDGVIASSAVTSQLIVFNVTSWTSGNLVIVYGDQTGGGAGATAPGAAETSTFAVGTDPDATYSVVSIASEPTVTVADPTATPTSTVTFTVTNTPTATVTNTVTDTVTDTPTATNTNTVTDTVTNTPTSTVTDTITNTPTNTVTITPTSTPFFNNDGGAQTIGIQSNSGVFQIISSASCYLEKIIVYNTAAYAPVTLMVYDAATYAGATTATYRFSIPLFSADAYPKEINFNVIGGSTQYNSYNPYWWHFKFSNGILISPTAGVAVEGTFYIKK